MPGLRSARAGEQLVPGAEAGPLPVDLDVEPPRSLRLRPVGMGVHRARELLGEGFFKTLGQLQTPISERGGMLLQQPRRLAPGPRRRCHHQVGSDEQVHAHIDLGIHLLLQPIEPRGEMVLPPLDLELPDTQDVRD